MSMVISSAMDRAMAKTSVQSSRPYDPTMQKREIHLSSMKIPAMPVMMETVMRASNPLSCMVADLLARTLCEFEICERTHSEEVRRVALIWSLEGVNFSHRIAQWLHVLM